MFRRSNSVHIDAPPEAIFDYVSDFTRHPEWAHAKIEIESVEGTGPAAGARYQTIVHFMGTVPGEFNVVESEPPRRLVYECGDKASRYRWTFELQPEGSGTKVTHSFARLKEAKWFVPIQPVLYPILGKKMVAGGLANIKAKWRQPKRLRRECHSASNASPLIDVSVKDRIDYASPALRPTRGAPA